jgi:hypothetical protein
MRPTRGAASQTDPDCQRTIPSIIGIAHNTGICKRLIYLDPFWRDSIVSDDYAFLFGWISARQGRKSAFDEKLDLW